MDRADPVSPAGLVDREVEIVPSGWDRRIGLTVLTGRISDPKAGPARTTGPGSAETSNKAEARGRKPVVDRAIRRGRAWRRRPRS